MKVVLIFLVLVSSLFGITKIEKLTFIKSNKLITKGYYKEALEKLEPVIQKFDKNDKLLYLKGKILKEQGKLEESTLILKKVLTLNQDNMIARKLIEDIDDIENAKQNNIVKASLEWLSDKGVDFLFIFFGILGGELLIKELLNCTNQRNNNEIKRFVYKLLDRIESVKLSSIKCFFINSLMLFTTSMAIVVVVLLIEFLINFSYLDDMTHEGVWVHIFIIFIFVILVHIIFNLLITKDEITIKDISDSLVEHLHNDELKLLRHQLELLKMIDRPEYKDIFNKIFDNILIDDDKETLENIYLKLKKDKD
ncbi:MAG: tetratricopeptide repeat protein [Campylobacterota bacterium]|nr:tetratricopeptide repeat protein [Campylobacterota bacterium]